MMTSLKLRIARVAGIDVFVDASWVLVGVLVTWSLATGVFAADHPELDEPTRWVMGAGGAVGLLLSVVLHELAHALTALRFDVKTKRITLFLFGGVAELAREPPTPRAEFLIALAGPLLSAVLAVALGGSVVVVGDATPGGILLDYLGRLNLVLALFNLAPAFPLDGGRVLRALLWHFRRDLVWATRVTAGLGSAFGLVLIGGGVVQVIAGQFVGGMWLFLLGMFLRNVARGSVQHLTTELALEGKSVGELMTRDPITVAPELPLDELVGDYAYRWHHRLWPVVEDGVLLGALEVRDLAKVPREEWARHVVRELMRPAEPALSSRMPANVALRQLQERGSARTLVVDDGRLVGVLTLHDLMSFLSLRLELEAR